MMREKARSAKVQGAKVTAMLFAVCIMLLLGVTSQAFGAEGDPEDASLTFENAFSDIQGTPVYQGACTATCHANIAKTKNYDSKIIFSHAYHQLVECASCHPRFPHRSDQLIERPTMKICMNCHGLDHGPMGLLATGDCDKCHLVARSKSTMPEFHDENGWAKKGHVEPSEKEANTKCFMCHTQESCVTCHNSFRIKWEPVKWGYDASSGCLACHASSGLSKATSDGRASFTVSGLSDSVHRDVTCQDCHRDYNYINGQEEEGMTNDWRVNAGISCAECHARQEDERLSSAVARYEDSTHAEAIENGNLDSATCGSCHGGHYIYSTQTATGKERMHASAYRTCARCKQHGDTYTAYNDYYHGRAYKAGAPDAPPCWQCHNSHDIWPSSDKRSSLSTENSAATCGQEGCHKGADEKFTTSSGQLIHDTSATYAANPLVKFFTGIGNKLTGK